MSTLVTIYALSALAGLLLTSAVYPFLRRFLPHKHRPWGPQHHLEKAQVPTGGGIVAIAVALIGSLVIATLLQDELAGEGVSYTTDILPLLFIPLAFGLIGFVDDLLKSKTGTTGFKARYKIILQVVFALVFLHLAFDVSNRAIIPFRGGFIQLPYWLFIILGTFAILMLVNGCNFTDGLDGLLGGVSLIIAFTLIFILGILSGTMPLLNGELQGMVAKWASSPLFFYSYVLTSLAGVLTALLIVNFKPAHVYLGDTGSYFIGAFLAVVSILGGLLLYLLIIGAVVGIEVASVVLQVVYFRLTGGKRILKMSPLHHHFELSGMSELGTVTTFWGFQLVASAIAITGFLLAIP